MLSATAVARKATTNVTTPSESSIINCRDSNEVRLTNDTLSGLQRARKRRSRTERLFWNTTPSQPLYRLEKDEERTTQPEPGTLP
jgi:hypothetical protein